MSKKLRGRHELNQMRGNGALEHLSCWSEVLLSTLQQYLPLLPAALILKKLNG